MKSNIPIIGIRCWLIIFFAALSLAPACTNDAGVDSAKSVEESEYSRYEKDGFTVSHPKHWRLSYDESPSLYMSRGIGFEASEFSAANVYLSEQAHKELGEVTDLMIEQFNLMNNDNVDDYRRMPLEVGGLKGEILKWTDTMICCSTYEVSVFKVQDSPEAVFAVFIFSDEDIEKESKHREKFLNSISFE